MFQTQFNLLVEIVNDIIQFFGINRQIFYTLRFLNHMIFL